MKKLVSLIILIVIAINSIIPNLVLAEEFGTKKENFGEVSNAISPDAIDNIGDRGTTQATFGPNGERKKTMKVANSESAGGGIVNILVSVINTIPNLVVNVLPEMIKDQQEDIAGGASGEENETTNEELELFTIQSLIWGKYSMFDINFFENVNSGGTKFSATMSQNTANWYYACRTLAIGISLLVVIYVGIRMSLSTLATDKVKYKKMLADWLMSFILIFVMQYIVIIAIEVSEGIIDFLPVEEENIERNILYEANYSNNPDNPTKGIMGAMEATRGWNVVPLAIMYWTLIYYQLKFFILYTKRVLVVSILLILSPLITVTYAIDKVGDNKAQGYQNWFKEIMINIFIQPLHAMLYLVFFTTAGKIAELAPLLAILFLMALSRGEKIVKNIFSMRGLSSISSIGSMKFTGKK